MTIQELDGPVEPREQAIRYLQTKVRAGEAGFDQYDRAVWIVQDPDPAIRLEFSLGDRLLLLGEHPAGGGSQARYIVLEGEFYPLIADLGLDPTRLPTIATPLASRAV